MTEYAFPHPAVSMGDRGMTLRDYFAAAALTAVVTRTNASSPENIATAAYTVADAMLKERDLG
jgi:hypothetical protein